MELGFSLLLVMFIISVAANIFAVFKLSRKSEKQNDRTASELLHDLTAYGNALVRIERIAPTDVLLRSPRQ
jgi:Zn-dependent protease with chaperone function